MKTIFTLLIVLISTIMYANKIPCNKIETNGVYNIQWDTLKDNTFNNITLKFTVKLKHLPDSEHTIYYLYLSNTLKSQPYGVN